MKKQQPAHWVGGWYDVMFDKWSESPLSTESELVEELNHCDSLVHTCALSDMLITVNTVDEAMEKMRCQKQ